MGISKDNIDKLNNFNKSKNLSDDNNLTDKNHKEFKDSNKLDKPSQIFYSLIDNSETLNETSDVNHLLRKSEHKYNQVNSNKTFSSKNLSTEDELYDEFNYLLDE